MKNKLEYMKITYEPYFEENENIFLNNKHMLFKKFKASTSLNNIKIFNRFKEGNISKILIKVFKMLLHQVKREFKRSLIVSHVIYNKYTIYSTNNSIIIEIEGYLYRERY